MAKYKDDDVDYVAGKQEVSLGLLEALLEELYSGCGVPMEYSYLHRMILDKTFDYMDHYIPSEARERVFSKVKGAKSWYSNGKKRRSHKYISW